MRIGIIAADTSRTRAYLHALRIANIKLQWCLKISPGSQPLGKLAAHRKTIPLHPQDSIDWPEAHFDPYSDLQTDLETVCDEIVDGNNPDINNDKVIQLVSAAPCETLIYSGYGGALLRQDILSTGKLFLHVHGGYLPDFKGSTTNYFSLLTNSKIGASSIFLTSEIDGGPILYREEFDPPVDRTSMDHIFDNAARSRVLVKTILTLREHVSTDSVSIQANVGGNTFYIIHPLLKHLAILGI